MFGSLLCIILLATTNSRNYKVKYSISDFRYNPRHFYFQHLFFFLFSRRYNFNSLSNNTNIVLWSELMRSQFPCTSNDQINSWQTSSICHLITKHSTVYSAIFGKLLYKSLWMISSCFGDILLYIVSSIPLTSQ